MYREHLGHAATKGKTDHRPCSNSNAERRKINTHTENYLGQQTFPALFRLILSRYIFSRATLLLLLRPAPPFELRFFTESELPLPWGNDSHEKKRKQYVCDTRVCQCAKVENIIAFSFVSFEENNATYGFVLWHFVSVFFATLSTRYPCQQKNPAPPKYTT